MVKKKFDGKCTKNARIKVDYSGVKPNVTFSYPAKKYQGSGSMFFYIFTITFLICAIIFLSVTYGHDLAEQTYKPTALEGFTTCAAENYNETLNNYTYIREELCQEWFDFNFGYMLWAISYLLFFPSIITVAIYFPFKKKWEKIYPKFNGWIMRKKYKEFKPKDVLFRNELGYYCEIPLFENIILDYNATKDFSKYLKFFEIEEHKFEFYKKKPRKFKNKKAFIKYKKSVINEKHWYTKFYFSKKPENGSLKVIFK